MAVVIDQQIEIRPVTVNWFRENHGLFDTAAHAAEIAEQDLAVDPIWPAFQAMEDAGALTALVLFVDDRPMGYSVVTFAPHTLSRELLIAVVKLIYLDPEARRNQIGDFLLETTSKVAKDRGAHRCYWHAKPCSALDVILRRWLEQPVEFVYCERF